MRTQEHIDHIVVFDITLPRTLSFYAYFILFFGRGLKAVLVSVISYRCSTVEE